MENKYNDLTYPLITCGLLLFITFDWKHTDPHNKPFPLRPCSFFLLFFLSMKPNFWNQFGTESSNQNRLTLHKNTLALNWDIKFCNFGLDLYNMSFSQKVPPPLHPFWTIITWKGIVDIKVNTNGLEWTIDFLRLKTDPVS